MMSRSSPSGALDPSVLECLAEALDDVSGEFVRGLTAVYEAQALDLMEQLSAAARASDVARINFVAHSLKGSSANVGGHRLVELCASLEHWNGSADQVTATVAALRTELAALLQDLRAFAQR
jgi:HPt (histidine-containing phosphotransfer) domain-containing protein